MAGSAQLRREWPHGGPPRYVVIYDVLRSIFLIVEVHDAAYEVRSEKETAMRNTGLLMGGVLMLLAGIALVIWGFEIEPTVSEAIGNVFDGEFTDKRNILKFVGIALCAVGGACVAAATFGRRK